MYRLGHLSSLAFIIGMVLFAVVDIAEAGALGATAGNVDSLQSTAPMIWAKADFIPLELPSMAYDSARGRVVMFGGRCVQNRKISNETWEWDGLRWKLVSITGPSARYGAAMTYDSSRQRIVLFGSRNRSSYNNEMWEWDGNTWSNIGASGPAAAAYSAMAYDSLRRRLVLHGGFGESMDYNGTWEWDGANWSLVSSSGPARCEKHAMAFDEARGQTILIGGTNPDSKTWAWNGAEWKVMSTDGPAARTGATMVYDTVRQRLVLFGGYRYSSGGPSGDTWVWDGTKWIPQQSSISPPGRCYHGAAFDSIRGRMVVFAGVSNLSATIASQYFGDTWEWDGAQWSCVAPVCPSPRHWPAMSFDSARNRAVLFGGASADASGAAQTALGDTWEHDGVSWRKVSETGPSPRYGHAMTFDSIRQRVILYGGQKGSGATAQTYDDVWEWDGSNWSLAPDSAMGNGGRSFHKIAYDPSRRQAVVFGGVNAQNAYLTDTWEWDGASWRNLGSAGPGGRIHHAMAYDPLTWVVVLYGGLQNSTALSDTWEWTGAEWTQMPATGPGAIYGHAMIYDPMRQSAVLFGGTSGAAPNYNLWEWDGVSWSSISASGSPNLQYPNVFYDPSRQCEVVVSATFDAYSQTLANNNWLLFSNLINDAPSTPTLTPTASPTPAPTDSPTTGGPTVSPSPVGPPLEEALDLPSSNRIFVRTEGDAPWFGETSVFSPSGGGDAAQSGPIGNNQTSWLEINLLGPARVEFDWKASSEWNLDALHFYENLSQYDTLTGETDWTHKTALWDKHEWVTFRFEYTKDMSLAAGGDAAWVDHFQYETTPEWTSAGPAGRSTHAMAFDAVRQRMVFFGGTSIIQNNEMIYGDTWEHDGLGWKCVSNTGPAPRLGHKMAFDPVRQRVILFGGRDSSAYYGDFWEWDGSSWSQISVSGPSPRCGHAMASDTDRKKVVLFGGEDGNDSLDDTWEWNGDSWRVTFVNGPSPRCGHAMAYDPDRKYTFLTGGGPDYYSTNANWKWDGKSWSAVDTHSTSIPIAGHSMTYNPASKQMVLVGGYISGYGLYHGIGYWDGGQWAYVAFPSGCMSRSNLAMDYDSIRRRILFMGGDSSGSSDIIYLNDTWQWDGNQWSGEIQTIRQGHAMAYDSARGQTVVFGGYTGSLRLGDTLEWNGYAWLQMASAGPAPRNLHAMTFDSARGQTLLFGGQSDSSLLGDTWLWDGDMWYQILVGGPSARSGAAMAFDAAHGQAVLFGGENALGYAGDTWLWQGTYWLRASLSGPSARSGHAMAYDPIRERTVLFGGKGPASDGAAAGLLSDTWEWNGKSWTQAPPPGPPARYQHAMAFDAAIGRVVLFGGSNSNASLQDTWSWDGAAWKQIGNTFPSARSLHAMAFDAARNNIVLFGGLGSTMIDHTYLLNPPSDEFLVTPTPSLTPTPTPSPWASESLTPSPTFITKPIITPSPQPSDTPTSWTPPSPTILQSPTATPTTGVLTLSEAMDVPATVTMVLSTGGDAPWFSETVVSSPSGGGAAAQSGAISDNQVSWIETNIEAPARIEFDWKISSEAQYDPRNAEINYDRLVLKANGVEQGEISGEQDWAHKFALFEQKGPVRLRWEYGKDSSISSGLDAAWLDHLQVEKIGDWLQEADSNLVGGPAAQSGHAMAYDEDRQKIVVFASGETWEWDGSIWASLHPANSPSPRIGHAMVYDSSRKCTVLFGGMPKPGSPNSYDNFYMDTWEWDGVNWTQIIPSVSVSPKPCARAWHCMIYDESRRKTLMFGGYLNYLNFNYTFYGDTWEWDGRNWTQAAATGPSKRQKAAMVYDRARGKAVLFGGDTVDTGGDNSTFGDTWEWDGTAWSQVASGGPSNRSGHAMAYDMARQRTLLFGGSEFVPYTTTYVGDTWEWDGVVWKPLATSGPSARQGCTMVYDAATQFVALWGGDANSTSLGDTWLFIPPGCAHPPTPIPSPSPSASPTPTPSNTPSATFTSSLTPSPSRTVFPSRTPTPSPSPWPSATPSPSPWPSATPSPSPSPSVTSSPSPSPSATSSPSPSPSATSSPSPSPSVTSSPSPSPSATSSPSPSPSATSSPSPSISPLPSDSPFPSPSASALPSLSATPSPSNSPSPLHSPSPSPTLTPLPTSVLWDRLSGIIGVSQPAAGADRNGDGVLDVADLFAGVP